MIRLSSLSSVDSQATLLDTANALKACNLSAPGPALVRVTGRNGSLEGVVGMVDVIRGLEPKYAGSGLFDSMRRKGFPENLMEVFVANHGSEHISIGNLVKRANTCTVSEVLRAPFEEETIPGDVSIGVALDTLVLRRREYLLVMAGDIVEGVVDSFLILDAALEKVRKLSG